MGPVRAVTLRCSIEKRAVDGVSAVETAAIIITVCVVVIFFRAQDISRSVLELSRLSLEALGTG